MAAIYVSNYIPVIMNALVLANTVLHAGGLMESDRCTGGDNSARGISAVIDTRMIWLEM